MIDDAIVVAMALLLFAIIFLARLSLEFDNAFFMLPAGIMGFLLAFVVWDATADLSVTLAMVVLGIILMATAVRNLFDTLNS